MLYFRTIYMYVFILQVTMGTWYTRLLWTEPMWTHKYARKSYNKQKWNNLGYKKTTNLKTTNLKIVRIDRCILPTIVTFIRGFMKIAPWVQTSVIKRNVNHITLEWQILKYQNRKEAFFQQLLHLFPSFVENNENHFIF